MSGFIADRLGPEITELRKIFFRNLVIDCAIGIEAHERRGTQRIAINVEVYLRPATPVHDDDIAHVFDYHPLRRQIVAYAQSRRFNLQETLVEGIVGLCLEHAAIVAVKASSEKLDVYEDVAGVGIEIVRVRG